MLLYHLQAALRRATTLGRRRALNATYYHAGAIGRVARSIASFGETTYRAPRQNVVHR
jgi:hypothetical protein